MHLPVKQQDVGSNPTCTAKGKSMNDNIQKAIELLKNTNVSESTSPDGEEVKTFYSVGRVQAIKMYRHERIVAFASVSTLSAICRLRLGMTVSQPTTLP